MAFAVDERELRHALAARGAVVELELGGDATPAVLKDAQRHPVRGHTMHVDFLRVRLDVAIHAVVTLELIGGEDAPGAIEGGVLEHVTREVNIEALPNDIPERLQLDVSAMQVNDTLFLSAVTAPGGRHDPRRPRRDRRRHPHPAQAAGRARGARRGGRARAGDRARRRGRGARRGRGRAARATSGGDDAADESSE